MTEKSELEVQRAVTIEAVLWVAVIALAAILRFGQLGSAPLSPMEADSAFSSWQAYLGQPTPMAQGSLLTYGTALLYFLLGVSDISARFLPALAGTLLVALPLLFRPALGRWQSIFAAAFLALSPSLVIFSRTLDSAVIVAALSLAFVGSAIKLHETCQPVWGYALAITMGGLLVSGPLGYTSLLALICAVLFTAWRDSSRSGLALVKSIASSRYILALGLTIVLIATGLLSNLHGLQVGLVEPFAAWGQSFAPGQWPDALLAVLHQLSVYDTLPLVIGLMAVVWPSGMHRTMHRALLAWLVVVLTLGSLMGVNPGQATVLAMPPLALLASAPTRQLLRHLHRRQFRTDLLALALLAIPLLWLIVFAQSHVSRPNPYVPTIVAGVPIALLFIVALVFIYRIGFARLGRAVGVLAIVVLSLMTIHTVSMLNRAGYELATLPTTSQDVRTLAREVKETRDALAIRKSNLSLSVDSSLQRPLAWYLRDLPVVFTDLSSQDSNQQSDYRGDLVVAPTTITTPTWQHVARRYELVYAGQMAPTSFGEWWLWFAYREPIGELAVDEIDLYIRY